MAMTSISAADMSRMSRLHMDRMADDEEDPTLRDNIKYPGQHDVMLGRGGESTYHCGNIAFRQLVEDHKTKYYTCPRAHKSRVVAEVVQKWRLLTPPGRFLTRTNPAAGDKSPWHDVGDGRALKKASHSLRDAVRCFAVEKKQRAQAQEGQKGGGEEAELSVGGGDTRKRVRSLGPEFFLSSSRVGSNQLGRELERVQARKQKIIVAGEERAAKRQRVVSDEREEEQEDCRREGGDGVQPLARPCCDDQRDCGRQACDLREALESIPSSIAFGRAPPAETFSFEPSFFAPEPLPLREPKKQLRAPRMASPCGSADWFTPVTEDLPVQASFQLPTADILVNEVVVSNNGRNGAASDDDSSLGWFPDLETNDVMASFTVAPLFNVDLGLHRPVAVPSRVSFSSSGRE